MSMAEASSQTIHRGNTSPDWRGMRDLYGNNYYWTLNKPDGKKYWGRINWIVMGAVNAPKYKKNVKRMAYKSKKMVKKYLMKELTKQNTRYWRAENKKDERYYAKKQKAIDQKADEGYQSDLRVKKYKVSVVTSEKAISKYGTKIKLSNTMIKKHIKKIKQLQKKILKELGESK